MPYKKRTGKARESDQAAQRRYRLARYKAGKCMRCKNKRERGLKFCRPCLDNQSAQRVTRLQIPGERERERQYYRDKAGRLKSQTLAAYGGCCNCCGESHSVFLVIDHLENNGNKERERLGQNGAGPNFYAYLKRQGFPAGYQVLCWNCNAAKSILGKCPHKN